MNLSQLFETQAALDARIYESHPELKGQDNLDWKVLALQVELGECANEWRGFKKWSHDQEPRTTETEQCERCGGSGFDPGWQISCMSCEGSGEIECGNPLLEEYVDCLHFILSIGIELKLDDRANSLLLNINWGEDSITLMFQEILSHISDLFWNSYHGYEFELNFRAILSNFIILGEMLGFTWEQIEQAYYAKNKINHQRQEANY